MIYCEGVRKIQPYPHCNQQSHSNLTHPSIYWSKNGTVEQRGPPSIKAINETEDNIAKSLLCR